MNDNNTTKQRNLRIAIPMNGEKFSEHFGGAKEFLIFDAAGEAPGAPNRHPAPEHKPGALPEWLAGQKVDAVIASAIGERALLMLADAGIDTFLADPALAPADMATACLLGKLGRANQENSRCNGEHHHEHDNHCA